MNKLLPKIPTIFSVLFCLSQIVFAQDYTTGLVAHYEFENTTGTVLDAVGTHHGEISGSVTRDVKGKIGRAFKFNGGGVVDITNHEDITEYSEFTIAAWARPTSLRSNANKILAKVTPNRDFVLAIDDQPHYVNHSHFAINISQYKTCYGTSTVVEDQWVHVLAVWSNNQWKVYYNAILEGNCDYTGFSPAWTGTQMVIGALTNGRQESFIGDIDEVRIYNRALSEADIIALYNYSEDLPQISILDTTVNENDGQVTFTVSLDTIGTEIISGSYTTMDGSATNGNDYTSQTGTFSFNIGDTVTTVSVPIIDDTEEEPDEIFKLVLSEPQNGRLAVDTGTCTITANDFVSLSVNDITTIEEEGEAIFTISLDTVSAFEVTGNYSYVDGTALEGIDYTGWSGTFTIPAGDSLTTVSVPIIDDDILEIEEYFKIVLSEPEFASLSKDTGLCTILTNDLPLVAVNDTTVSEDSGEAIFTVSIDKPSFQTITGNYATMDASSDSLSDYTAVLGEFTINPGETSLTIAVPIINDSDEESDEVFHLLLKDLTNGILVKDTGTCVIPANDLAALSINDTTVLEDEGQATFVISLNRPSLQTVSGTYTTLDNTAEAGSDYTAISNTFTINTGDTFTTVTVEILDDMLEDNGEFFSIVLSNPNGATLEDTSGICTINDMVCTAVVVDCPVTSVNSDTGNVVIGLILNKNELSITNGNAVQLPLAESLHWKSNGTDIIQKGTGNVGIGTPNPDQKLTVNGNIHAKEVIVDLNVPGPDYVFEKDYALRTIKELEDFLKQQKHLPDIPPASQMEDEGINLSVLNMMLLKRIEELTLYIIDQEKRIMSLEKKNNPKSN